MCSSASNRYGHAHKTGHRHASLGQPREGHSPVRMRIRRAGSADGRARRCRLSNSVADGDASTCGFAEFSSEWRTHFSRLRGGSYNRTVVPLSLSRSWPAGQPPRLSSDGTASLDARRTLHLVRERSDLLERIRNTARYRTSHQAAADTATRELRSLVHDGFALKIPGRGAGRSFGTLAAEGLPAPKRAHGHRQRPSPAPSAISPPARRRNSGGFFEDPIEPY
jgi:hypothetical protein